MHASQAGKAVDPADAGTAADVADLPAHLRPIVRQLARQVHDREAGAGAFDALPAAARQQACDRCAAMLETLLAMGWRVTADDAEAPTTTELGDRFGDLARCLDAPDVALIDLFKRLQADDDATHWSARSDFHTRFGRALISAGHASAAFDYVTKVLAHQGGNDELTYLQALALARGRNVQRARMVVDALVERLGGQSGPDAALLTDALSLAGRVMKDMARATSDTAHRRKRFGQAHDRYRRAYELSDDWYPGINAATMALLADRADEAGDLAARVIDQAAAQLQASGSKDYWLLATLGEAHLIRGDTDQATDLYRRAVALAGDRFGDIASMRRNVELLGECREVPDPLDRLLRVGGVIVFSGHMIDHPDRIERKGMAPRFPADDRLEHAVAEGIGRQIDDLDAVVGYCSAACGGDLLFAEQMLNRGRELHVVLPFDRDDFYITSVDFGTTELADWRRRCDRVLEQAVVHYATTERYLGDDVLFDFANRIMQGLALVRAAELGTDVTALLAYERQSTAGGKVGTASVMRSWSQMGRAVRVVDVGELRRGLGQIKPRAIGQPVRLDEQYRERSRRQVHAMLFSDVRNFSRLAEEHSPAFFNRLMQVVDDLLDHAPQPVFANTWGDALFMVFEQTVDCAEFAMALVERIEGIDWSRYHLPDEPTVRIGLHAGPVYRRENRVIGKQDVLGSHVNLAARIEPVATPGSAFASEHFAAELAIDGGDRFACEYMGVQELAKRFGRAPLYRLSRAVARS